MALVATWHLDNQREEEDGWSWSWIEAKIILTDLNFSLKSIGYYDIFFLMKSNVE